MTALPAGPSVSIAKLLPKAVLVLLGFAAPILAMELGLRLFGYAGDTERTAFLHDGEFGDVLKRSWLGGLLDESGRLRSADPLEINDETVPIRKPPSETRVLFLGDSGTYGAGVGPENSYPAQVRRSLEKTMPGRPIRVINSGITGLDTVNELKLFEALLRRLKPDIVIVGLFMANDINFNLKDEAYLVNVSGRGTRDGALAWLLRRSALAHFTSLRLRAANDRFKWRRLEDGEEPRLQGRRLTIMDANGFEFLNYLTGELALYLRRPSTLTGHAFELLERTLSRFTRLSADDGFRFGVLLIPTSSALAGRLEMYCSPNASEILHGLKRSEADLDFDRPVRTVLEICRRNRISCFDPTAEMRRAGARRVIRPGDDHPSELGHRILAQVVTEGIRPWLGRAAPRSVASRREGSLTADGRSATLGR